MKGTPLMLQIKKVGWRKMNFMISSEVIQELPEWNTDLEEVTKEIELTGGLVGSFSSEIREQQVN